MERADAISAANFFELKYWVEKIKLEKEDDFDQKPWFWYQVIHPALLNILEIITSIFVFFIKPFWQNASSYLHSFFKKEPSYEQTLIKNQTNEIIDTLNETCRGLS